jgi:hypothetical protein
LSSAAPAKLDSKLDSRSVPVVAMINLEIIASSRDAAVVLGLRLSPAPSPSS